MKLTTKELDTLENMFTIVSRLLSSHKVEDVHKLIVEKTNCDAEQATEMIAFTILYMEMNNIELYDEVNNAIESI
jgi:hypothetical protein